MHLGPLLKFGILVRTAVFFDQFLEAEHIVAVELAIFTIITAADPFDSN